MGGASKVLLESIQVARHVSRLGLRPLEKGAVQVAKAGEEIALWTLKLQPLQELIGPHRTKQILDSYFQGRDVVGSYVASLSHQSWNSVLQSGAKTATMGMRMAGVPGRVIGPLDEHWNTLKVLKDLRTTATEQADRGKRVGGEAIRLTPRRFVQMMRDSERRKRRTQGRDPIEAYVGWMLRNGNLSRMGPMVFEKKLYTDLARVVCFAFDRALMEVDGVDMCGHELQVHVSKDAAQTRIGRKTSVAVEQVEAVVDRMLKSQDMRDGVPLAMQGLQKQLLTNCSVMILQLIEELTSDRQMQVTMLGHNLRVRLEPVSLSKLTEQAEDDQEHARRFSLNKKAIDELVDALAEEPQVQLVLVPDLVEAEAYRYALNRTICIAQFILSQLRIRLFGVEVQLTLVADEDADNDDEHSAEKDEEVRVCDQELQVLLDRIEEERKRIKFELDLRHTAVPQAKPQGTTSSAEGSKVASTDEAGPAPVAQGEARVQDHEFQTLARQDRLSRSLSIQRTIAVPVDLAFRMVSDFNEYPKWMPFCTSARTLPGPGHDERMKCEVGFGLETGTMLGTVGDNVTYQVLLEHPTVRSRQGDVGKAEDQGLRCARVVADTADGFAYGKRLVYDWRFTELGNGETLVKLDMFFQAKSVFFLPLWDSMQATITSVMMKKFIERAAVLTEASPEDIIAGRSKLETAESASGADLKSAHTSDGARS